MSDKTQKLSMGIDVGSVTLKLAVLDEADQLLYSSYERHHSRPLPVLLCALRALRQQAGIRGFASIAVTGSARRLVGEVLEVTAVNEIIAQAMAVSRFHPGIRTIVEIGGQDSKFIQLAPGNGDGPAVVLTQKMNDICAAGTGAFVEQQAERMQIPIEEFGLVALKSAQPAAVAGRCAVFAKTDIVHLRQEGVPQPDIAAGICRAVARNYMAQFSHGKKFDVPIAFQGGLAANQGVVKAFRDILKVGEEDLLVPDHFNVMGAIGAALASRDKPSPTLTGPDELLTRLEAHLQKRDFAEAGLSSLPRLTRQTRRMNAFSEATPSKEDDAFVGIDVGSTSTCVAVMGTGKRLFAECYTLNKGNVIDSVDAALEKIQDVLGDSIGQLNIVGVGVTGSGRYLVSKYVGADVVRDEISAQAKAAVRILPDVDTVFEIGGQDSKYIRISDGHVADFEMNKVCAAGTGSFLQEQAARLKEEVGNLSNMAFGSTRPVDMGSRCTVFMESDLVNFQQMGVPKEDLIAGLSYSVARNYLEKVVGGRPVGKRILLLGGVAFNESVVAAFQQILKKDLIVPDHHETSAAIGMALIAAEELARQEDHQTQFRGFQARGGRREVSSFQCKDCANVCRIYKIATDNTTFCYGGVCGKYEGKKRRRNLPNIFKKRQELLLSYHRPESSRNALRIGIPRAQLFHEYFPLWCVFLQELGCSVVLSDPTNKEIVHSGLERTSIDNCFASKIMYGHVQDLLSKKVDRIFMPTVIEFARKVKDSKHNYTCPYIQSMPALQDLALPPGFVISPVFLRYRRDDEWRRELRRVALALGHSEARADLAVQRAADAQADFSRRCEAMGQDLLKTVPPGDPVCVILGKFYNAHDPTLNLNLAEKLLDLDIVPLPFDCLPLSGEVLPDNYRDMVFASGQEFARAAKIILRNPSMHPILVTNFQCTVDSFAMKYLEELFRHKSYLVLEVDEHTSDVGVLTRIEAFLNNLHLDGQVDFKTLSSAFRPFVPSMKLMRTDKTLYVSSSYRSYRALAAAFESIGLRAKMLPLHSDETEKLGRQYSSGKECNPYIMEAGSAVRMTQDPGFNPEKAALCVPSSDVGCRIALVSTGLRMLLAKLGHPQVPVYAPRVSMETDESLLTFGPKFIRDAHRGMLGIELMIRLLARIRPYEIHEGDTDRAFSQGVDDVCTGIAKGDYWSALDGAVRRFDRVEQKPDDSRYRIGVFGDDYTRDNAFANNNLEREIEALGCEVQHASIWSGYLQFHSAMKPRNMVKMGRYWELCLDLPKLAICEWDNARTARRFEGRLRNFPDPGFSEMMKEASRYVDPRTDAIIIIALARIIHLIRSGVDAIVNVVGFQCTVYNIVSAMLPKICQDHGNIPHITLLYDFQEKIHHRNRLEAFMYQVKQRRELKLRTTHRVKNSALESSSIVVGRA